MKISIKKIPLNEKENLRKMIFEYQKELLNTGNPGEYKYLDSYWQDEERFPFFILENDVIAGFVLVNSHSLFKKNAYNIAEFFIGQEHRRRGIGTIAIGEIFSRFPGNWEIRVLDENKKAQSFWRETLNHLLKGRFEEIHSKDSRWDGLVFIFSVNTMSSR